MATGNLDICLVEENVRCSLQVAPGGAFSFYLPDGKYEWSSFYDSLTRQRFEGNLFFSVVNGQTQTTLQWTKPILNIQGTAATNDGKFLPQGFLEFYSVGKRYIAWVDNGKFKCYLPNGIYNVRYVQLTGGSKKLSLGTQVEVSNGKLTGSSDFVFYVS